MDAQTTVRTNRVLLLAVSVAVIATIAVGPGSASVRLCRQVVQY